MKRIKEIINYIMDSESREVKDPSIVQNELKDLGYSNNEIKQALSMLHFEEKSELRCPEGICVASNRVLGEGEKLILSTEAQGYLIKLTSMGWLSEAQLNLIIENAGMEYTIPVSLDEIREITTRYIPEIPESVLLEADCAGESHH